MSHKKSPARASRRFVTFGAVLLTALAVSAPIAARQGKDPATVVADSDPLRGQSAHALSIDARGNWMREYVQLRLVERNLGAVSGKLSEAELKSMFQPRIVGGTLATGSDNPFTVALVNRFISNNFDAQFCAGTLIAPTIVVTAAHCSDFIFASQVQVLTGTRRLDGSGVRRNVANIQYHPSWNRNTFDYDVAVWRLTTPVNGVPFASLATATPGVGTSMLLTGWGKVSETGSKSIDLRKASVPLVSHANCNDSNSYNGRKTPRMICAGFDAGGRDACQSDSGGPLARGSVLTGIVSWGEGCARPNKFGVYTRVSDPSVRDFIVRRIP